MNIIYYNIDYTCSDKTQPNPKKRSIKIIINAHIKY